MSHRIPGIKLAYAELQPAFKRVIALFTPDSQFIFPRFPHFPNLFWNPSVSVPAPQQLRRNQIIQLQIPPLPFSPFRSLQLRFNRGKPSQPFNFARINPQKIFERYLFCRRVPNPHVQRVQERWRARKYRYSTSSNRQPPLAGSSPPFPWKAGLEKVLIVARKLSYPAMICGLGYAYYYSRKVAVPKPEPFKERYIKEIEKTQEIVRAFNCSSKDPNELNKILNELQEIKFLGGQTQRRKREQSIDPKIACLRLIAILECENKSVQLDALDYLTILLNDPTHPYSDLQEWIHLEHDLGQHLEKLNIQSAAPIVEQTLKIYARIVEHLVTLSLRTDNPIDLGTKKRLLKRAESVQDKLESSSFKYHVSYIYNLAKLIRYKSQPLQETLQAVLNMTQSFQKANSFIEFLKSLSITQIDQISVDKGLKALEEIGEKIDEALRTLVLLIKEQKLPQHLQSEEQYSLTRIFLRKIMIQKLSDGDLENLSKDQLKEALDLLTKEAKDRSQNQNDWPLYYGTAALLGELVEKIQNTFLREQILISLDDLTSVPKIPSQALFILEEILTSLQQDRSLENTLEEPLASKFQERLIAVTDNPLAFSFKETQSKKEEFHREIQGNRQTLLLSNFLFPGETQDAFIERPKELKKIAQYFRQQNAMNKTAIQIIAGMGGSGKSQLAIHYAKTYCMDYKKNAIYFIRANDRKNIEPSLNMLAEQLLNKQLNEGNSDEKINQLKKHLEENPGWLLVIDSLDQLETETFAKYLPQRGGHIIITSRNSSRGVWESYLPNETSIHITQLERFSSFQSVQFIKKNLSEDQFEKDKAKDLANTLSQLPLALSAAVAYIKKIMAMTIPRYINARKNRGIAFLKEDHRSAEYRELFITFSMNFDAICKEPDSQKKRDARDLFILFAHLGPHEIPLTFLYEWIRFYKTNKRDSVEDLDLNHALTTLSEYSLVVYKKGDDSVLIHPLTQEIAKDYIQSESTDSKQDFPRQKILKDALKIIAIPIFPIEFDVKKDDIVNYKYLFDSSEELDLKFKNVYHHILSLLDNSADLDDLKELRTHLYRKWKLYSSDFYSESYIAKTIQTAKNINENDFILSHSFAEIVEHHKKNSKVFPKKTNDIKSDSLLDIQDKLLNIFKEIANQNKDEKFKKELISFINFENTHYTYKLFIFSNYLISMHEASINKNITCLLGNDVKCITLAEMLLIELSRHKIIELGGVKNDVLKELIRIYDFKVFNDFKNEEELKLAVYNCKEYLDILQKLPKGIDTSENINERKKIEKVLEKLEGYQKKLKGTKGS